MAPLKDAGAAKPLKPAASGVTKSKPGTQPKLQKEHFRRNRKNDLERHQAKSVEVQQHVDSMDTSNDSKSQIMAELDKIEASERVMKDEIAQLDQELMDIDKETDRDKTQDINSNRIDPDNAQPSIEGGGFDWAKPFEPDSLFDEDEPENLKDLTSLDNDNDTYGTSDLLGDGEPLWETNGFRGRLFLNSYGPRSGPILTWRPTGGSRKAEEVPFLHEGHSALQLALQTTKEDKPIHFGKIKYITGIAWKPRRPMSA